ncbi:MAG: hypothetical protein JJE07_01310 [Flavobacteriaceae bacterium]|nr:hypothetical protein [Flavobacteriaceae bacterium]
MKDKYYVYALIDPRDKEIFYIGKGSGNRLKSHLNEKGKNISNIHKYLRIQEIQNAELQVKIEVLFPYLYEKEALFLEKLVIYKLGRKCFKEGVLLNVVPGGNWKPGESVFYDRELEEFDIDRLDFVARERYLSINKISDFRYWKESLKTFKIFKYNKMGMLISVDSLDCFFRNLSSNNFDLYEALKSEDFPINDFEFLYATEPLKDIYVSPELPLPYHHFFDSDFCRKFDVLNSNGADFDTAFKKDGKVRIKAKKEGDTIILKSYYKNGNKKSFRSINNITHFNELIDWNENGELLQEHETFIGGPGDSTTYHKNGKIKTSTSYHDGNKLSESKTYYETGVLKDWNQYFDSTRRVKRIGYFESGKLSFRYDNLDHPFTYIKYNEKGNVVEKYDDNKGYVSYDNGEKEERINTNRQSTFIDYHKILKPFIPKNPSDEIREKLFNQQQKEADEAWEVYMGSKKRK